jgi:hypothetical protein
MAPRIKNISPDEFHRIFQAPEIATPGLTVSDAINLQNSLETRRSNDLDRQRKIAQIERDIAKEEQQRQDIEILSQQRGFKASQDIEKQAREDIDPSIEGPEAGPLRPEDLLAASQAQQATEAEVRLSPEKFTGPDQADVEEKKNQDKLNRELKLIQARGEEQQKVELLRQAGKNKEAKEKQSGLDKKFLDSTKNEAQILVREIDRVLPKITDATTGVRAQLTRGVAGTDARKLASNLDSIKAIVGFAKLQEMRNASKTGGALGQVSERENILLQSSRGSLDQLQGEDELKLTLNNVKKSYKNVLLIIELKNMPGFDTLSEEEQVELFELKQAEPR